MILVSQSEICSRFVFGRYPDAGATLPEVSAPGLRSRTGTPNRNPTIEPASVEAPARNSPVPTTVRAPAQFPWVSWTPAGTTRLMSPIAVSDQSKSMTLLTSPGRPHQTSDRPSHRYFLLQSFSRGHRAWPCAYLPHARYQMITQRVAQGCANTLQKQPTETDNREHCRAGPHLGVDQPAPARRLPARPADDHAARGSHRRQHLTVRTADHQG